MSEISLEKACDQNAIEKQQYDDINKAVAGGGGGGNGNGFVTPAELEERLDTSLNLKASNPTSNDFEPIDDCLSGINANVVNNATNIATNTTSIATNTTSIATNTTNIDTNTTKTSELDGRVTNLEAGSGGGGGGATVLELNINDYIDVATNTGTIDCLDLDPSVAILNFIYPPTTGEEAKSALEIFIINIASTKIKTITFAPSTLIVTSATNKDYTKLLSYFRFKLYKTSVEEEHMYATLTSGRVFVVIRDTGFSYTPEDTAIERITKIGLYKNKYSFYFERDVLTDFVDKLFFFDANVIFSTRLDTAVYDQRFLLKLNYSICLFVDEAIFQFAFHSADQNPSFTVGARPISAINKLIKADGTTEIETLAYNLCVINIGQEPFIQQFNKFFFNYSSYVTSAFLNSSRVTHMEILNSFDFYTYLQIGIMYEGFYGYILDQSVTSDYEKCTLKSVALITFRGEAIIFSPPEVPDIISILPVLYMNAYFYES